MDDRPPIVTSTSLREYFKDMVGTAIENQKITVAPPTEFYVVNLLAEFLDAENLFRAEGDGSSREEEPLAFILKRAQEQQGFERVRELKRLGDTSLYVSGYWGDSLGHKLGRRRLLRLDGRPGLRRALRDVPRRFGRRPLRGALGDSSCVWSTSSARSATAPRCAQTRGW